LTKTPLIYIVSHYNLGGLSLPKLTCGNRTGLPIQNGYRSLLANPYDWLFL